MTHVRYTDAQQLAFIKQLKQLSAIQLLVVLVFVECQDRPDRAALIQRIVAA